MTEILNTLSLAALVAAHNNLAVIVDADDIKTLKNKTVGRERVTEILGRVNEFRKSENLPAVRVVADGKLENVEETSPESEDSKSTSTPVETKTEPKPAQKAKGKKPGRAPSISPSDVIILKVTENPKRATAADRFSNYRTGMTVAEYASAVDSTVQATRDILWDKKQGWVDVVGAKTAVAKAARAELKKAEAEPVADKTEPTGGEPATPDAAAIISAAPEATGSAA